MRITFSNSFYLDQTGEVNYFDAVISRFYFAWFNAWLQMFERSNEFR